MKRIHLWVPGRFDRKGGIQTFSRFLVQALNEHYSVRVLSKHDSDRDGYGTAPLRFRTAAFSIGLVKAVLFDRPDLVVMTHIHFAPVAYILDKLFGIPFVVVCHGVEAWGVRRLFVRLAMRRARLVLAVSETTAERIVIDGLVERNRIRILPNTADEVSFDVRPKDPRLMQENDLPIDSCIVLTVCRLDAAEQYKGYDGVIDAFSLVAVEIPNLYYIIVGDGDDRPRVEEIIDKKHLGGRVRCVGRVSDEDLPRFYNCADIFVMPGWGEGFGIVFLEALFSGLACIGSHSDGSRDALGCGDLGTLVTPGNRDELVTAIIAGIRQTANRDDLRARARKRFGFEAFRKKVTEIFLEDRSLRG